MNDLVPVLVIGTAVFGTYKLFELFVRKNERILTIEKLIQLCENDDENQKRLKIKLPLFSTGNPDFGYWPLRISLLLIGIGLGCLIGFLIQASVFGLDFNSYRDYIHRVGELYFMINFASISIFGGIGLLSAFLIEQKMKAKNKETER